MSNMKTNAYDLIKSRIINSTYPADSILDEKQVVEELGTSRTPVREAIIALSQEGYLRILPKRGTFVTGFTYNDVVSAFQVRSLIEPWLISTYGAQLTREDLEMERQFILEENHEDHFKPGISINHHPHTLLLAQCKNPYILNMLHFVEEQNKRVPSGGYSPDSAYKKYFVLKKERIINSHLRLVDMLLAKDIPGAVAEMQRHVEYGKVSYLKYWFNVDSPQLNFPLSDAN